MFSFIGGLPLAINANMFLLPRLSSAEKEMLWIGCCWRTSCRERERERERGEREREREGGREGEKSIGCKPLAHRVKA